MGLHQHSVVESLESRRLMTSVPTGFVDQTVITGLSRATSLATLPDGRWLVTEQNGRLRVVKNNQLLPTPAVSVNVDPVGERGLLGVAVDPAFASNNYVYVYFTVPGTPSAAPFNRINRYTLAGDVVAANSGVTLVNLDPLTGATNHNAGAMHFGADGKLYVAVGDNATPANAQTLANRHGKMLRLNSDGSIPTDNPFYTTTTGDNRSIYSYGLRNPYTFAFNAVTGNMYINEVGQSSFEEVNVGRAGANYGWPATEGYHTNPLYDQPLYAYGRDVGRSVTGGVFYAGATQFPADYRDDYFFGDFVTNIIQRRDGATGAVTTFATQAERVVDLDIAADGSMLYLGYGGTIGSIRFAQTQSLQLTQQPQNISRSVGQRATFAVGAISSQPISYQWFLSTPLGATPITGATNASYTTPALEPGDSGKTFFVRVSDGTSNIGSRAALLSVLLNTAPTPTISTPANGRVFSAGQTISFAGSGVDTEDGALPGAALDWTVTYFTGAVERPFTTANDTALGSFVVPRITPYTATDVKYRIRLTATDSRSASTSTFIDIVPAISTFSLSTTPVNIPILLDGQPQNTPANIRGVQGLTRTLEAPQTRVVNGITYTFVRWNDNGPRSRTLNTPPGTLTLQAVYARFPLGGSASMSGRVILDQNRNARLDPQDTLLANRRMYVDLDNDGVFDTGEPTRVTTTGGQYNFTGLLPGTYKLRTLLPGGSAQVLPLRNAGYNVTLTPGQSRGGFDFYVVR